MMQTQVSRWPIVAAFAMVGAATQVLWLSFAPVTTVAAEHYGVSESAIGWLANVFPLFYVVLAIPAGLLLDRWFTQALAAGAVLTAVGGLLRLIGDDFVWVLTGQIVIAIAQPLVLNAITGITGRYLAEEDRPAGIAIGSASTFAGMIIAFLLGAIFTDAEQLGTLIAIGAAFSLIAAVVLVVALRTPFAFSHQRPPAGLAALRIAWNDDFIRRLCVLVFFPFGTFVALTTFAQALLEPAGVDSGTASIILLLNVLAGVVGCAVLPIVAARRGWELKMLVLGAITAFLGCVALAVAPGAIVAYGSLTLIGFLLLPALPIVLAMTERRSGEVEGTAAGLIWMSGNLGGLVVATIVGLLVDHPGPAFLVAGIAALLAVPLVRGIGPYLGADAEVETADPTH
ncbi:MFS transporter [Antrihabitans spumae]|uniref:MFS transporter n=1 Tax=Antrihabitans spumae TaxID=3373370 RepID=A0ABW7KWR6_9NOCA